MFWVKFAYFLRERGNSFSPSLLPQCPMPNAQCPMPNSPSILKN
ncbi:MAG: hypothetical protein V7K98_19430 [Nostoc sp.]